MARFLQQFLFILCRNSQIHTQIKNPSSITSWNQIIRGFSRSDNPRDAVQLFDEMLAAGGKPDGYTYSSVINACARGKLLRLGEKFHGRVVAGGFGSNLFVQTNLVNLYAVGGVEDARKVFDEIGERNVVTWNTLLAGYIKCGELNACKDFGLVEQGHHIFKNMKQVWGIDPKIEHYGCMVDLLSRAGPLDEAHKLIQNIPMEPNDASVGRSEIAFFDLETTVLTRHRQGFAILEFGAILVCHRTLVELKSYGTFVKPDDLSLLSKRSVRANGITADTLVSAPTFSDIADKVYDFLHGRIWAGHNINRFDCVRLREAFAKINRPPPEPKGTIDSLTLLTRTFGKRAGNMKMATLADHFGLGKQSHRSLYDIQLNLEVIKNCATVLFLEPVLADITKNCSNAKSAVDGSSPRTSPPSSSRNIDHHTSPPTHPVFSLVASGAGESVQNIVEPSHAQSDPFGLGPFVGKTENEPLEANDAMEEESSTAAACSTITESTEFVDLDHVSIPSVTVTAVPCFRGPQSIQILHRDAPLQIRCDALKVRFGLSTRYVDHAGRARLSFVVDASSSLCGVLDACDDIAKRFVESDSNSEWRSVVCRKSGFCRLPTIRLQLPTVAEGDGVRWITEMYQKESSSSIQQVVFSRYDVAKLKVLIRPGSFVDAFFSLDPYDYQQNAGIRLVAKKLIVDSN